jgi:hypothetical protein
MRLIIFVEWLNGEIEQIIKNITGIVYLKRVQVIAILILGLWLLGSACTSAPPAPVPWFTEHIKINSRSLPAGVGLEVVPDANYRITNEYLIVTNSSSIPLYLTGTPMTGNATFEPLPMRLPTGTGPINKVVSSHAFRWEYIIDNSNTPARLGWVP